MLPTRIVALLVVLAVMGCSEVQPSAESTMEANEPEVPSETEPCIPQRALSAYIDRSYDRKLNVFRGFDSPTGGAVFLGSSIIEEGPWEAMFPALETVNRGISGDTTVGVLNRLDDVQRLAPKVLVLYIGGNDFSRLGDDPAVVAERYAELVAKLQADLPEAQLILTSLFPREGQYATAIETLNTAIRQIAEQQSVELIDLYADLLGTDGAIDPAFSNDSIHLNANGYRLWQEAIKALL